MQDMRIYKMIKVVTHKEMIIKNKSKPKFMIIFLWKI